MPAIAEYLLVKMKVPFIVDYDDAQFHRYDKHRSWLVRFFLGRKIDSVMRNAMLVIAGNEYLAQRARTAGARRVEIIPSVVDLKRYFVSRLARNLPLVVGWIGSPATSHYLRDLGPVFNSLKSEIDVRFVAVGASQDVTTGLPIATLDWSEQSEIRSLQTFDIGIMPLVDSHWERGKCGYKLIQYMACGLPVVASPVGFNNVIVEHGINGFLAYNLLEWENFLRLLLQSSELRNRLGANGRKRVEVQYSLSIQANRLNKLMSEI